MGHRAPTKRHPRTLTKCEQCVNAATQEYMDDVIDAEEMERRINLAHDDPRRAWSEHWERRRADPDTPIFVAFATETIKR